MATDLRRREIDPELNVLSGIVVDAALKVHRHLGPGLVERVYHECLLWELRSRGVKVESEVDVAIRYGGLEIPRAFRVDLLVGGKLLVELKACEIQPREHTAQLLTYVRLSGRQLGLVINFGAPLLRQGIKRVINTTS
jgi:GxxExxY protein